LTCKFTIRQTTAPKREVATLSALTIFSPNQNPYKPASDGLASLESRSLPHEIHLYFSLIGVVKFSYLE
jgi:hypothetical protein